MQGLKGLLKDMRQKQKKESDTQWVRRGDINHQKQAAREEEELLEEEQRA